MTIYSIVGLIGVVIIIASYGLLSAGKLDANKPFYQWLNIIGTSCILVSLIDQWNLPAFISNAAWILVGTAGLIRQRRKRAA